MSADLRSWTNQTIKNLTDSETNMDEIKPYIHNE